MSVTTAYIPRHARPHLHLESYREEEVAGHVRAFDASEKTDVRSRRRAKPLMRKRQRYSEALLSDPITRVEWDAMLSAGRDPLEWYDRLPMEQRRFPEGVAGRDGSRFRVGLNVWLVWPAR